MNPTVTGGLTLDGSQVGPVVQYLSQLAHVTPPSDQVAALIGVAALTGAHAMWVFINTRFPPRVAPVAPPAPAATP